LKISLFNDVAYQFNPEWVDALHCDDDCSHHWDCNRFVWLCRRFPDAGWNEQELGPPTPQLWNKGDDPDLANAVDSGNIIQGFFSRMDIERLRNATNRTLKLFTVLRHPIERSLSWMQMLNQSCPRVPWAQSCAEATYISYYKQPPVVRTDVGEKRQGMLAAHIVSYGHNSMTWQLGHHMHSHHRDISEYEALQSAKEFLEQMDAVYFFEDMLVDFPRLWLRFFSESSGSKTQMMLYMLGCIFGYPRMHTLKYSAHLNFEEKQAVMRANELDTALYEWAQARFGARFYIYDSYTALLLSWLTIIATAGIACLIIRCAYMCGRPQHLARKRS